MVWLKQKKRELEDYLRYSPLCRQVLARVVKAKANACAAPLHKLDLLCKAIRLTAPGQFRENLIGQASAMADSGRITRDALLESNPEFSEKTIRRGIILKPWISEKEPGVLFISFETEWTRLLNIENLKEFSARYHLVVAPSWSPPHSALNYLFPRFYPGPVFNLISNPDDLTFFPQISETYQPVNLYASNWVNPDLFVPLPKESRDIDLLMVANFGTFKRHSVLFRALRTLPGDLRVTLIGQPHANRTLQSIMDEARAYGIEDRITIRERVYGSELMEFFCRAKVSVVLSKREGSCVVVTESMFADTPVGLLNCAAIGSKAFVNDATGCLLPESNLADALVEFIQDYHTYSPRQWALEHEISCQGSARVLNDQLKSHALQNNEEWTHDTFAHHWRPDPTYMNDGDREAVHNDARLIRDTFGIEFKI